MNFGRKTDSEAAAGLETRLAELGRKLVEAGEHGRQHEQEAARVDAQLAALAPRAAAGELSDEQALQERSELEAKRARHSSAAAHHAAVATAHEADRAGVEAALRRLACDADYWAAEQTCEAARTASGAVATVIGSLEKHLAKLERARAARERAIERARANAAADENFVLPANADEPDWPAVTELLQLLTAGSWQPLGQTAAALAAGEKTRATQRRQMVEQAASNIARTPPGHREDALRLVAEDLRPAVLARAQELQDDARARLARAVA